MEEKLFHGCTCGQRGFPIISVKVWEALGHRNTHPKGAGNAAGLVLTLGRDRGGNSSTWSTSF